MDDRLDPRFAAALRTALLDQVRDDRAAAPAPAPRRRFRPVLAIAIAVVAVLAIATGGLLLGQRRAAPPAAPLDGDCAAVATSGAASDLVGAPVRLQPAASLLESPLGLPLAAVGGITCSWAGDDPRDDVGLDLTIVGADLRPAGAGDLGCFSSGGGGDASQWTCRVDRVAGGRWTSGFVTGPLGGTQTEALAAVAALDARLAALPAEDLPAVDRSGWWRRLDCDAVDSRARLGAALGQPQLVTGVGNGGMTSAGLQAAMARTGYGNCLALVDGGATYELELHTYPGAGAALEEALQGPGVRRLADVGDARVYRVTVGEDAFPSVWVVAPGGALQLTTGRAADTGSVLPAIAPLLRLLDADRRP